MRVTVLGAGVAGLACAVELAERGAQVEVLEPGERLGSACCSWYAGGMLAPWCELEGAEPLVARLGSESLAWWKARYPETVGNGSLVIAHSRDTGELARFARRTERFVWVRGETLGQLEPLLAGRFQQALYFEDEAHLDPRAALTALVRRLGALGVTVRFGVDAHPSMPARLAASRRADGVRDGCVIDCTGLAARGVLSDLRGVKGEMLVLRSSEITLSRPVRVLHPRIPVYIVPRGEGLFMVGATMIEGDEPDRITVRSMLELLSAAYALHPAFGEAQIVETGTGVRPAFPDNLPRIAWHGGTLYVNGLYRHGFLIAPSLARMAAEVVLDAKYFPEVMRDEDSRQRFMA
jgi:glycine oxidase